MLALQFIESQANVHHSCCARLKRKLHRLSRNVFHSVGPADLSRTVLTMLPCSAPLLCSTDSPFHTAPLSLTYEGESGGNSNSIWIRRSWIRVPDLRSRHIVPKAYLPGEGPTNRRPTHEDIHPYRRRSPHGLCVAANLPPAWLAPKHIETIRTCYLQGSPQSKPASHSHYCSGQKNPSNPPPGIKRYAIRQMLQRVILFQTLHHHLPTHHFPPPCLISNLHLQLASDDKRSLAKTLALTMPTSSAYQPPISHRGP